MTKLQKLPLKEETAMSLILPTRTSAVAPRNAPRPSTPVVSRDEVDLAVQLIVGLYEPLKERGQELFDFAVSSRQSAFAIVQIGWAFAKVELEAGSREWYFKSWLPEMKAAKNSVKLEEKTPEGRHVKLGRGERDVLIETLAPVFNAPTQESQAGVAKAIIGKHGLHIRTSLRLLEMIAGEEGYTSFKAQLEEARRAEVAAIAAVAAAPETDKVEVEEAVEEATGTEG
jgi:hypothetical protein